MSGPSDSLVPLGWDAGWAAALADVGPDARPGRVLQHHGAGLVLALPDGVETIMFTHRLVPEPTVGDWVAVEGGEAVVVLPRRSLLRRRAAIGEGEQALAANVDTVLLVCGLDRPVKDGRIQRGTTIARDAGAEPVVVLTKASRPAVEVDPEEAADEVRAAHPGIQVLVTSVKEGQGLDELRTVIGDRTVTLLGESGAGKSSIVNAAARRRGRGHGRRARRRRQGPSHDDEPRAAPPAGGWRPDRHPRHPRRRAGRRDAGGGGDLQ